MKYFGLGLLSSLTGFLILVWCCDLMGDAAVELGVSRRIGGYAGNVIGFSLLFGGPFFFWVMCPFLCRQRRRKL